MPKIEMKAGKLKMPKEIEMSDAIVYIVGPVVRIDLKRGTPEEAEVLYNKIVKSSFE